MTAAGSSPLILASSIRTISLLIRSHGWRIVVSRGRVDTAAGESSKPPTATSAGTVRPARPSASTTPWAIRSDATNTASRSGARSSSCSAACSPLALL